LLGHDPSRVEPVFYSWVNLPEGGMSTRRGTGVDLDDLLDEAIARAREEVRSRLGTRSRDDDLTPADVDRIARQVGIGAVRYDIVATQPTKGITFRWEEALDFEAQSAPYVQYVHARCCGILDGADGTVEGDGERITPDGADADRLDAPEEVALLRTVEHPPGPTPKSLLVGGALPHLPGVRPLAPLENVPHQQAARLGRLVQAVCGGTVSEDQTVLIVEEATAGELWRAAADRRTSTALEADRKVVRSGFLRSVELIPEGSVFLSHVSLLGPEEPEPDKIQLGAWESLGFGWAELAWFDPETARRVEATDDAGGTPSPARASRTPGVALVMGQALEAVEALAEAGEEPTAAAGRAAVRSFGWRFRERGPQAVLAFELAKARPRDPQPSAEVRAHRWLLLALGVHQDAFAADPAELKAAARNAGECRPLIEWIESAPFETPLAPEEEWALLDRLGWLRRYAELLLPTAPEARKAAP
ncbi:MAG: arginine--tRNA ligase, partial [bacterium]